MTKLKFSVDNVGLIEEKNDSQFAKLRVDAFASGRNAHDMYVSEETLRVTANTIIHKPLVFVYDVMYDDIGSHDDMEVPGGFVPHDSEISFSKMTDGRLMLSCTVLIWKRYSGKLLEIFQRDREKSVSVEMEVFETSERPDGLLELLKYCFTAITALGSGITPAVPGAKAEMVSFSKKLKQEYNSALETEFGKFGGIDFTIPVGVKSSAKMGLELHNSRGTGKPVALAAGRYLLKNEKAHPDKIKAFSGYFGKLSSIDFAEDSKEYTVWMLYGGKEGFDWVSGKRKEIQEIENSKTAYLFSSEVSEERTDMADKKEDEVATADMQAEPMMAVTEPEATAPAEKTEDMAFPPEKGETPSDEEKEPKAEQDKEKEEGTEEDMSLDAYADVAASLAFLEKETANISYAISELKVPKVEPSKVMKALVAELIEMSKVVKNSTDELEKTKSELSELVKFKADLDSNRFESEVASVLLECSDVLPKGKLEELRELSSKFNLDTVENYKNAVRATAFTFAKTGSTKEDITRVGLPFSGQNKSTKKSLWDN
jgi:hypothetical protein